MTEDYDPFAFGTAPSAPLLRTFETADYVIRPLTAADATQVYADWVNDPEVNEFTQVRYTHQTPETLRTFIVAFDNRSQFIWGMFPKDDPSRHIGNHTLEVAWRHRTAMLGIMVGDKSYWGRDLAQQTRACLLDWIFDELGLHKVYGGGLSTNFKNVYNYQKQGWAFEGAIKEHIVLDGRRVDLLHFAMFRAEWLRRRERNRTGDGS